MQAYKQSTVDGNTKGIEFLFKKNKVDWLKGWGAIAAPGEVKVGDDRPTQAKYIVIATGSEPSPLPGVESTRSAIVDSTGALALPAVPKRLVVIGGGVIGLELGSVWRRLGARGDGGRVPRPDHPRHRREVVQDLPEAADQAGPDLHARRRGQGAEPGQGAA